MLLLATLPLPKDPRPLFFIAAGEIPFVSHKISWAAQELGPNQGGEGEMMGRGGGTERTRLDHT